MFLKSPFKIFLCTLAPTAVAALLLSPLAKAANTMEIELTMGKPKFVLPQFHGEFMKRESTIAPHELEIAQQLQELLDNDDKQAAIEQLSTFFDLELSAALLHLKGQVYFSLREYDLAEATFKTVLLRMPQMVRAHSDIGQLYLVKNDYKKAQEHFSKAIALGENSPTIYGQLGFLNLQLHNAHSAISMYQNALAIEPDNTQWQQGLLTALTQAKLYSSAISLSDEILKSHPNDQDLWLGRAFIFLRNGEDFKALASLESAILLGNKDANNLLAAAQLHLQLHSYDRATGLLEEYVKSGKYNTQAFQQVLSWLNQNKRWEDSSKILNVLSKHGKSISPQENSQFLVQQALVFAGTNKASQAKQFFSKALSADPSNTTALISAADFYLKQKDYVQAEIFYTRAEAFDDVKKKALLGRAQVMIDIKDYETALTLLRSAYRLYPDLIDLKENIAILENTIQAKKLQSI